MALRAWADLYRCVIYVQNVEIRGVCPSQDEDAFSALVNVVSEVTGVKEGVVKQILERVFGGLGREQMTVTFEELAEAVAFLARYDSADLGRGTSDGAEEGLFSERKIEEVDPLSDKEARFPYGLV